MYDMTSILPPPDDLSTSSKAAFRFGRVIKIKGVEGTLNTCWENVLFCFEVF